MADSVEKKIEADIRAGSVSKIEAPVVSDVSGDDLSAQYLEFLRDRIATDLDLSGLTLVLDCANGASYKLAPKLFSDLGARVIAINASPDGRNINLNCGSLHIESLQERVVAERADLGVAFDGDADRSLFVDSAGNFVDGDATLWVLANNLLEKQKLKQNAVVATVMSNIGLEIALRSKGVDLIRADVGDKYVLEELLKRDASLGGEQSGHIIMPELSLAGDGMLTAICLLRAMCESGKSLETLSLGFQQYPQILVNVRVREKVPFDALPGVQAAVNRVQEQLSQNGRLLLRYSGTELLARVMIEGANQKDINDYANQIADEIKLSIGA
jgi:phosphoglucosamine mutase